MPEPIFTPATKATSGHDENISFEEMAGWSAPNSPAAARPHPGIYSKAADYARTKGIIIADTKFEFGRTARGLTLADEVLTPDSSRFWPADQYSARQSAGFLRQAVCPRLSRGNSLEQATARAGPSGGRGRTDQREVPRGVRKAYRPEAGCVAAAIQENLYDRRGLDYLSCHFAFRCAGR